MFIFGGKPDIEKMKSRGDVKGLRKVIGQQDDDQLRLNAVQAIRDIGDDTALQALVDLLDECYRNYYKNHSLIQPLTDALVSFGSRAIPYLTGELRTDNFSVREKCTEILSRMKWKPGKDEAGARYWIGKQDWNNCFLVGRAAVQPLIEALKCDRTSVRIEAARTLGRLRDPRAIKPLREAMRDRDQVVCNTAAQALSKIKDPEVVALQIRSLKDADVRARLAASSALATQLEPGMLDEKALRNLCEGLRDSEWGVRSNVAKALARLHEPATIPVLIQALSDLSPDVKKQAAVALGEIDDPSVVEPLLSALRDGSVAQSAAEALEKRNWHPAQDENAARFFIAKGQWESFRALGISAEGLFIPPERVVKQGWQINPQDPPTTYRRYESNLFLAAEILKALGPIPKETYYKIETWDGELSLDMNGFFTNAPLKNQIHLNFPTRGFRGLGGVECKSLTGTGNDIANPQTVAWLKARGEYANLVLLMECGFCGYKSPVETQAGEFSRRCYCCGTTNHCQRGNILVFVNGIPVPI